MDKDKDAMAGKETKEERHAMQDWRKIFQKKIVTAEEALKLVKNGDRVVFGHACGEPTCLVEALVARAPVSCRLYIQDHP